MQSWCTIRTSAAVDLCHGKPANWSAFESACRCEFERTKSPMFQARAAAVALRLNVPVPVWAAAWLATALEQRIENAVPMDKTAGFNRGPGKERIDDAEKRDAAEQYQIVVMKLFIENEGLTVAQAAERTLKLLHKHHPIVKKTDAGTIEYEWHHGHRKIAEQMPPLIPSPRK